MKRIALTIAVLINFFSYAADHETTQLLLDSRTDQEHVKLQQDYLTSVKSIKSSNLDKQNITDDTLYKLLKEACGLETLSARHNRLHQPQPPTNQHNGLTRIDFSNGTIEMFRIGEWIDSCPNLAVIKLAHNRINYIASNDVREIMACTMCGPEYKEAWHSDVLQELDLSHNKLTEFDLNILNNAPNLTKADFSHNEITNVVVPKILNDRQLCTVSLQDNQLDDAKKKLLCKNNSHYTKDYNKKIGDSTMYSSIAGGCISMCGALPIAIVCNMGVATVGVTFGMGVGGVLLFGAPAYAIAHYCYPKNKRTWQPFTLEFEATEQNQADGVVELESQ